MWEMRTHIEFSKDRSEFFSEVTMASFSLRQYWWKQQADRGIKTTKNAQKQRWAVSSQGGWNDHRYYFHDTSGDHCSQWLDNTGSWLQGSMLFPGYIQTIIQNGLIISAQTSQLPARNQAIQLTFIKVSPVAGSCRSYIAAPVRIIN